MPKARVHTGVELDYHVTGRDDGVPLLFIHGGYGGPGTTIFGAARQLEGVFGDEVRLIRYSRRNAGASEYVLTAFDLPDIAADAAGLLDHLGVERAIVVGSSAGGPVALEFALTWPERLIALGLPNTGPAIMCEQPAGLPDPLPASITARLEEVAHRLEVVRDVEARGAEAAFGDRAERIRQETRELAETRSRTRGDDLAVLEQRLVATSDEELARLWYGSVLNWRATADHDHWSRLGGIDTPTCIIHGDADAIVPFEYGEMLRDGIAGAEFHRIADAPHGITQHPEAQAILRDWLVRAVSR
jgi:pimeloyl-ACP methyl ester carboxylesterase